MACAVEAMVGGCVGRGREGSDVARAEGDQRERLILQ